MKKAVVVGANYRNSNAQLAGCINDALNIANWLIECADFKPENVRILTDDKPNNSPDRANKTNLIKSIEWLTKDANATDLLFFSFAGHGAMIHDESDESIDNKTNVIYLPRSEIIPVMDWQLRSMLLDTPAKLIGLLDCCQSGGIFDLKYKLNPELTSRQDVKESRANITIISACGDYEFTPDTADGGRLTLAFLRCIRSMPSATIVQVFNFLMQEIFETVPEIHCGRLIDINQSLMKSPTLQRKMLPLKC